MRKLRSDALWHKLTADQQAKIQTWLFEDHLSYRQTHARMRQEFGIVCALSGLSSIYHHCEELRSRHPTASLLEMANMVNASGTDAAQLHSASKTLIAAKLLEKSMHGADVKEIAVLGRLLLKNDENEIRRTNARFALNLQNPEIKRAEIPPLSGINRHNPA
jgi:hypothetical protein